MFYKYVFVEQKWIAFQESNKRRFASYLPRLVVEAIDFHHSQFDFRYSKQISQYLGTLITPGGETIIHASSLNSLFNHPAVRFPLASKPSQSVSNLPSITTAEMEYRQLKQDAQSFLLERDRFNLQLGQLGEERDRLKVALERASKQGERLQLDFKNVNEANRLKEARISKLELENKAETARLESQNKVLQDQFSLLNENLRRELEIQRGEQKTRIDEMNRLSARINGLTQENEQLRQQQEAVLRQEVGQREIPAVTQDTTLDLDRCRQENAKLREDASLNARAREQLQKENSALLNDREQFQKELNSVKVENAALNSVKAELNSVKAELNSVQAQLNSVKAENAALNSAKAELNSMNKDLQNQLASSIKERGSERSGEKEKELDLAKREKALRERQIALLDKQKELMRRESDADAKLQQAKTAQETTEKLKKFLQRLKDNYDQRLLQLETYEASVRQKEQKANTCQQQLIESRAKRVADIKRHDDALNKAADLCQFRVQDTQTQERFKCDQELRNRRLADEKAREELFNAKSKCDELADSLRNELGRAQTALENLQREVQAERERVTTEKAVTSRSALDVGVRLERRERNITNLRQTLSNLLPSIRQAILPLAAIVATTLSGSAFPSPSLSPSLSPASQLALPAPAVRLALPAPTPRLTLAPQTPGLNNFVSVEAEYRPNAAIPESFRNLSASSTSTSTQLLELPEQQRSQNRLFTNEVFNFLLAELRPLFDE
jgi:myosin heavy subunit